MNFRNALIAVCLGSAATGAVALALGNARGAVVLGRPVDLAFDVHPDAGKSLEDSCITADMVSGASTVASGRVRVTPLPTLPGRAPSVRVQSTLVADEPMLTVTLSAGCAGKISRTYTFLADLPETVAPTTRPIAIPMSALPAVPADAGASPPREAAAVPAARRPAMAVPVLPGAEAPPVLRPRAARASEAVAPVAAPARAKPAPAVAAARKPGRRSEALAQPPVPRSRLVVEPLETWLESPSQLRLTTELALPAAPATPEQRAQAQAEWRALNMGPQELLQESGRMVALNTELSQLRGQAEKDRAQLQQLLQRLEKEKSERYSSQVVYLLLALLVLVLTWAAWMASRLRAATAQAQEAWAGAVAQQNQPPEVDDWHVSSQLESAPASLQHPETAPDPVAPLPEPPAPEPQAPVAPAVPVAAPAPRRPEPPPVLAQPALMVDPEALFDLQQQAEFFVSVGEHSQAIGVLKKYIASNASTAPAAYLELLRLYRSLSRVDDFNLLRVQFHQHFNAQVPEFAAYNRHGRSLLGYPEVLAGIEAIWSHESVLPLLDSLLFRNGGAAVDRFDLAAYDDLLLINAIARTTPPSTRGAPPPRQRTTPLLAEDDAPDEVPQAPRAKVGPVDHLLDNGDSLLEYDSSWLLGDFCVSKPVAAPAAPAVPVFPPGQGLPLDFDLSDPFTSEPVPLPPLTESELPPVPVTQGPAPGQAVGFGANSDRFEARHDPEERKKPG